MLFAHHIGITIFGREFEPEGIVEHVIAFSASALILFLASYGAYTLIGKLLRRGREENRLTPRP